MNASQDFVSSLSEGAATALAVSLLLLVLLLIVSLVLMTIASWKIFVKAGEKGWKSLIPFYAQYIQFRIGGISKIFWINLPVMILLLVLNWTGRRDAGVYKVLYYSDYALQALSCGYIARAFGKKTGFCIATALLPMIFLPILGFGSAKYSGTKG